MSDILNSVRSSIKLDGYGQSERFIGFFEINGKYTFRATEVAVDFFMKFHATSLQDAVVTSSLHLQSESFCKGNKQENALHLSIMQPLIAAAIVPLFSYDIVFGTDYESAEYDASVDAARNDLRLFRATDFTSQEFRNLLLSPMSVSGLYGHCFVVFNELGLAYYPHDYQGFGVVALHDSAHFSVAHEFLNAAGDLGGYTSVIER